MELMAEKIQRQQKLYDLDLYGVIESEALLDEMQVVSPSSSSSPSIYL